MELRKLFQEEQTNLYPLLGECFGCWKSFPRNVPFPFEADSFAALDGERIVAHCAVVKFEISDGRGGIVRLGGIALVCTDPAYRHRGLAEELCRMAIRYAEKEKLAGLPLFTSFGRVYAKNHWRDYPIFMPESIRWKRPGNPGTLVPGAELSGKEKEKIISLYENGFDFPGKVLRPCGESDSLFSWKHHFGRFCFLVADDFYAAGEGNFIYELYGDAASFSAEAFLEKLPRENGVTLFALPENSPFRAVLARLAERERADVFFHGPMVLDLDERRFFERDPGVYFPLTDRF